MNALVIAARSWLGAMIAAVLGGLYFDWPGPDYLAAGFPSVRHDLEHRVQIALLVLSTVAVASGSRLAARPGVVAIGALFFYSTVGLALRLPTLGRLPTSVWIIWEIANVVVAASLGAITFIAAKNGVLRWKGAFLSLLLSELGCVYLLVSAAP